MVEEVKFLRRNEIQKERPWQKTGALCPEKQAGREPGRAPCHVRRENLKELPLIH
jgi:hypothetical protein